MSPYTQWTIHDNNLCTFVTSIDKENIYGSCIFYTCRIYMYKIVYKQNDYILITYYYADWFM